MLFSSPIFIFAFLPIVLFLIGIGKKQFHNSILLIASLIFYAWGSLSQTPIFIFSIIINYIFGLLIDKNRDKSDKLILTIAVIVNLGLLGYYKYFNFLLDNINLIKSTPIEYTPVGLPIGISFFTFHALSYVIDVYRKKVQVQKNFLDLALYISFFPQLIAGPIVRYYDVATQFANRTMSMEKAAFGIQRFIFGLAKKVIVANTFAFIADGIFNNPAASLSTSAAWLGIISYTIQIYFDFSGYSDMALGLAKIFGFDFPENFNYPYSSQSIKEFWRRWHISLSTWFRDFLYIPLGGNKGSELKTLRNLLIVFFCTGFWHGANWTFIVWGMYHGLFLLLERLGLDKIISKLPSPLRVAYTLLVVMIGWVFFRADKIPEAWIFIERMFGISSGATTSVFAIEFINPKVVILFIFAILYSFRIFRAVSDRYMTKFSMAPVLEYRFLLAKFTFAIVIFFFALAYLAANTYNPFIYFRF